MIPMKKAMAWLLALVLTLVMPVAFAAELADGIYEATAPGMNGDITVHAVVFDGEILKITTDHSESAEVGAPAIDELIRRVIDVQDPDVDIVTGATQTSEAFVDAMKAALTQAGWEEAFEMDIIQRWTPAPAAEVSAPQISFPGGQADQTGVNLVSGDTIVMNWHAEGDVQKYHVSIIDQNGAVIKAFDTTDEAGLIEASSLVEREAYTLTVIAIPANGALEVNGVATSARFALYIALPPEPTEEPVSQSIYEAGLFEVGNMVSIGRYEQDNDVENGKEEIEWIVLANNGQVATLISRYGLENVQYNAELTNVTWESSLLRYWLNNNFIREAFTDEERNRIITVNVSAKKNPKYATKQGNDTQDKVFVLDIEEAERYFHSDSERLAYATPYVLAKDIYFNDMGSSWWWLRNMGKSSTEAARVRSTGAIKYEGILITDQGGMVRPVIVFRWS